MALFTVLQAETNNLSNKMENVSSSRSTDSSGAKIMRSIKTLRAQGVDVKDMSYTLVICFLTSSKP